MSWYTRANGATLLRALMTIPVVWALLKPEPMWQWAAFFFFGAAAATDGLDGYLARRFHEESRLGEVLDPIADKILGTCVFAALVWLERLPTWMLISLLVKESALLVGGALLLGRGVSISRARPLGKVATVILFIGMADTIASITGFGPLVCGVGVTLSLLAGMDYALITIRNLRPTG